MIRFQNPILFLLLLVLPGLVYRYLCEEKRRRGSVRFSDLGVLKRLRPSRSLWLRHSLIVLRILGLSLAILAIARPQSGTRNREILTEGVDIVLAIDVSTSMQATDLNHGTKTRLAVCKKVVSDFVRGRTDDRLGMVVFAGESFTQCPLTLDHGILLNFLGHVNILMALDPDDVQSTAMVEDGTAIGTALATATNRLRETKAKSKIVVLLTDGVSNKGEIDPITAAKAAAALRVKVYTIGAGSEGTIMQRITDPIFGSRYVPVQVEIDEETLQEIARITSGRYYRATTERSLERIYREISELEKTEIKAKEYVEYTELFGHFLLPGLVLLLIEIVLGNTRFRRIP